MTDPARHARRLLLLPTGAFFATTFLAFGLAMANAWRGGPHLAPQERLWPFSLGLIALYCAGLFLSLRGPAPVSAPVRRRAPTRLVAVTVSTLASAPVIALLLVPALNGVAGLSAERSTVLELQALTRHTGRTQSSAYYFARLEPLAQSTLPAGRYFVGRYGAPWIPGERVPVAGTRFEVRYRTGLLGATSVLSALPLEESTATGAPASSATR